MYSGTEDKREREKESTTGRGAARRVCDECRHSLPDDGCGQCVSCGYVNPSRDWLVGECTALRAALERAERERDEALEEREQVQGDLTSYREQVIRMRRRLDEAREALRPMAEWFTYEHAQDDDIRNIRVRVGDIRRAAAVVKGD